MRRASCLLGLVLLASPSSGIEPQGLPTYRFQGLRGQVVADETGQPLARVSVLAVWGPDGVVETLPRVARFAETETAADGTFDLAPWEAALSVPVQSDVPRLLFLAPGRESGNTIGPHTFRLRKFDGTPEGRAAQLNEQAMTLAMMWGLLYGEPAPRILEALDREWKSLPSDARGNTSPSAMYEALLQSTRGGYEQEILRRK